MTMRRFGFVVVAGVLILLGHQQGLEPSTMAQETTSERAFVYGINAAIPDNFVGTFAPPSVDEIFLLADGTSIISARYTEIYFWPITNEYRADWSALNEPVPGVLEVIKDGRVVAELSPTDYTIHFKQEGTTTTGELFLGQAAVDAEAEFRSRQDAFHKAASEYQRAEQAWLDAMAEASSRQQAGETVEIPPEPVRPDPIGIFSNGLNRGFPIDLGPGQYRIRLRDSDGNIVPGSERALNVFAPRRTGVGYTIVPETRWTTPVESSAPSDVIFGTAESALYLEPHLAREYPARDWLLLQNPQRLPVGGGGWEWVNGEQLSDQQLEIIAGNTVVDRRTLTSYTVRQVPGSQLGYEVIEMDSAAPATPETPESQRPDFEAYPIDLQGTGEQYQIRLTSEQGEVVPGSIRQVRVPGDPPITRLLVLPVIPLVVGALAISRRRRARSSRPLEG
ncbi:MAG TPA: hypothetical protein VHG52_12075 [Thermomicrobiales bacterium]|nr:hypothetical protein [Thermomicrobiales bacterium]